MFSHRPITYPRSWREMSLEFKSMFVYHLGMMVMFMAGGLLRWRLAWRCSRILCWA
jgi:hypothetical protein